MRKICVITGSRAEYGLLSGLMSCIKNESLLKLQVVVTNMHLSPEFGLTYKEIENDGFEIDKKVEMLLSSDTPVSTAKSVGIGILGFSDAYDSLKPDIIVVLGDRYEILSAVTAALFLKIPVAHIHGGEITEGAYDDAIRHAITKMSHLHFTSTEEYRKRVIQLGENPDSVFNVGALGVENSLNVKVLSKNEVEKEIDFVLGEKSLLITFHPVTLDNIDIQEQMNNLFKSLDQFEDYKVVFTMPNSDFGGREIKNMIKDYVSKNPVRCISFNSLGKVRYLNLLRYVTAVIGNSSSGIIEVPSFYKPTLNIGDRQKGRICSESIVNTGYHVNEIVEGLKLILSDRYNLKMKSVVNPYYKTDTAKSICNTLIDYPLGSIIKKTFYNL